MMPALMSSLSKLSADDKDQNMEICDIITNFVLGQMEAACNPVIPPYKVGHGA